MSAHQFTRVQQRLWLPTPPSTNNLFRTGEGNRRYRASEYVAWDKLARQELMLQRPQRHEGKVTLAFFIGVRSPIADCSNFIKAPEDLLCEMGLIEGDTQKVVQGVSADWVPNYNGMVVHITPYVEHAPRWLGFDAGVMGQVEGSPLNEFVKSPQTLGKARRVATGAIWATGAGARNKKKL